MKALVAARDDRILGFTMIGTEAGEVKPVVQMAMLAGMPYTNLRDAILAHPTMAEGLGPLFSNVPLRQEELSAPVSLIGIVLARVAVVARSGGRFAGGGVVA